MTHISLSDEKSGVKTSEVWKKTGIAIGELANEWSQRYDIICQMTEDTDGGAPALFRPHTAEIFVSTSQVFANLKPEQVGDFKDSATQFEFPKATGAVLHEAFHARFSGWSIPDAQKALNKQEFEALMLLEEGRIEAYGVRAMPWSKNFLQACAMDLVIADSEEAFKQNGTTYSAANMVALVHARLIAGILDESNCPDLVELIDQQLGAEVISQLRGIIRKVQQHSDHENAEELYKLAKQWVKIVNKAAKENGEATPQEQEQMMQEFAKAMRDAMREASESTQISNTENLHEQEQKQMWEEQVAESQKQAQEQEKNKDKASEVFSRRTTGISGSRLTEERLANQKERSAAVTIARMLEQAKYRDRSAVEVASYTPPGRLRTRAIVQNKAMKSRGVVAEVEPWRKTVRKHTEDPNLTLGVMVDISGSMFSAMEPMATTAWVLSEAAKRIQARTAMVYYGSSVFPTLKPGQHLDKVRVFTAEDSTEEFDDAFRALDGGLNLLNGSGARLLVVVSDGHYREDQRQKAKEWVKICGDAGVGVLWLPFGDDYAPKRLVRMNKDAQVSVLNADPATVATEIGKAASTALTKVGSRR